jgi:hypothetical protein
MPSRSTYCRFGADLPKNSFGRTGAASSSIERHRLVSAGNASCMTAVYLANKQYVRFLSSTLHTRSRCSSAAKMFSPSSLLRSLNEVEVRVDRIIMGRGGQMSSVFLTGVLESQKSRRSRRQGDANTRCRHFWHTCTSLFHGHVSAVGLLLDNRYTSKIFRRTLSGSLLIDPGPMPR